MLKSKKTREKMRNIKIKLRNRIKLLVTYY